MATFRYSVDYVMGGTLGIVEKYYSWSGHSRLSRLFLSGDITINWKHGAGV